MYTFLSILYLILVIIMIVVILMQEPRESGLSPALGGMQQILGVRGIPTFFTRLTWGLGATFMILSLVLAMLNNPAHRAVKTPKASQTAPIEQKVQEPQEQEIPQIPQQGR
uniref:Protein-export membrane protein SecG n=1 Tax=candidate division WOR-3 bacterium TaxID=2052148 RepID=A0A7C2K4C0_UNCW3